MDASKVSAFHCLAWTLVFSKRSSIIHKKRCYWDFCYKPCFLKISASVITNEGALFQHKGSSGGRSCGVDVPCIWNLRGSQGGSRGRGEKRLIIGEGVLTAQIIGFICILNEIFWPVVLGAVEFVGNQKILVRRGKRRNDSHSSAFQ